MKKIEKQEKHQFYVVTVWFSNTAYPSFSKYNLPALLYFIEGWEKRPETYNPNIIRIEIEKED